MTNVREQHIENRICFHKYFASYIIISSGPKKSNTIFFKKKGNLPGDERYWPNFSRIIECDKRQGTFYKGPKVVSKISVEVRRSFVQDLRGSWKHKNLKKKAIFLVKKRNFFGVFLPVLSSVTNLRGQLVRVKKVLWQLLWKL